MTDQPRDYAVMPDDDYRAVLRRGERVLSRISGPFEAKARALAWLGFWVALAILGTSAMWAWVYDRDSQRDHAVAVYQITAMAQGRGSSL